MASKSTKHFDGVTPADDEDSLLLSRKGERKHGRRDNTQQDQALNHPSWMSVIVFALAAVVLTLMYRADLKRQHELHQQRVRAANNHSYDKEDPDSNLSSLPQVIKMNDGSKYTGTQFISLAINTFGGMANKGECKNRDIDYGGGDGPTCYLGNFQNMTEDFEHRLDLLIEVLDGLKEDVNSNNPRIDHRKTVLKIFMLPEFYLRGPEGAYPIEALMDDGILFDAAHRLSHYIRTPEFSDYLFVFGTVIGASRSEVNNAYPYRPWDAPAMDDNEVMYFNFAPIFRGGIKGKNEKYIVTKKTISKIDFLNNITMLPNPIANSPNITNEQYDRIPDHFVQFLESRGTKVIQDGILEVNGIRVGIEICLDHKMGKLWQTLQKTGEELVDVHLITSAGMEIEFGPNPIVPGGVTYLSDGVAKSSACLRPSSDEHPFNPKTTCRVPKPKAIKHYPPVSDSSYSDFFTMSACQDVLDFKILKGYYSLYQTQGCSMSLSDFGIEVMDELKQNLPSVEYYPTVDLPSSD